MLAVLSAAQKDDAAYVASLATPRERMRLDLSDPRQYRHAISALTAAGQTPDSHPGLHAALDTVRDRHAQIGGPEAMEMADPNGFATGASINAVTKLANTANAASTGFATVLGGATMLTASLSVYDPAFNLLAAGTNAQYGDGTFLDVATAPESARPATSSMLAELIYSYQQNPGDPIHVERVQLSATLGGIADPTVTQPVKSETESHDPRIRIGLGRGPGIEHKGDVDYWLWQNTSDTRYAVPMVGYVDFNSPVALPLANNVQVFGYLVRGKGDPNPSVKGGIAPIPDAQKTNVLNNLEASGNRLMWNLPAASVYDPGNPGNPIVWGNLPWSSDETTYVVLQFYVRLQGQLQQGFAAVQSTDEHDTDPYDGVASIPPLEFLYHCIAGDAAITLADGGESRLDQLTRRADVRSAGDGSALTVLSTRAMRHDGPAIRLVVDAERSVVVTLNHLVLTPEGPRRADTLVRGDRVVVAGGSAPLAAVEVVDYDGLLCNVSFSYPGEPVEPAHNSMLANGIAVCDYAAQVQAQTADREDPERILSVLDPIFHEDFRNHLERYAVLR